MWRPGQGWRTEEQEEVVLRPTLPCPGVTGSCEDRYLQQGVPGAYRKDWAPAGGKSYLSPGWQAVAKGWVGDGLRDVPTPQGRVMSWNSSCPLSLQFSVSSSQEGRPDLTV